MCELELPLGEFYKDARGAFGVRSNCINCHKARRKASQAGRREAINAKQREYYARNSARCIEYQRNYRRANRGKLREYFKARYASNADHYKRLAMQYVKDNPDVRREIMRKRRAAIVGSSVVKFTTEQLMARMSYWGNKCWQCGGPFEEVDHVKPLSKGGPHMLSNLRPSCRKCNRSKSAIWPLQELNI